jgi:hypothetical protein
MLYAAGSANPGGNGNNVLQFNSAGTHTKT